MLKNFIIGYPRSNNCSLLIPLEYSNQVVATITYFFREESDLIGIQFSNHFENIFFEEKIKVDSFIRYLKIISLCLYRSGCDSVGSDFAFSVKKTERIDFVRKNFNILFYKKEELQFWFTNKIKEIELVYEK